MFNMHCSQAPSVLNQSIGELHSADLQQYPPQMLKTENNYNMCADENLLRTRYRKWYKEDYNLSYQIPPGANQANEVAEHSFLDPSHHNKSANNSSVRNMEGNAYSGCEQHFLPMHSLHFSPSAPTDSDLWDVIFQGSERRNSLVDSEKSVVFSSAAECVSTSHKHRNFSEFLDEDEAHVMDSSLQSAHNNPTEINPKVISSSSNNNNNANYSNSYESEVFLTDPNFATQRNTAMNYSHNSQEDGTTLQYLNKSIKTELSSDNMSSSAATFQSSQRESLEMISCQDLSALQLGESAKTSSQTTLPPISLLSGRKASVKNEEEFARTSLSITSSQSYKSHEETKPDDSINKCKASENFDLSPAFSEIDSTSPSNFCLYGQRARNQSFFDTNEILKDICKTR